MRDEIKLLSSTGDETLARRRYFLHGTTTGDTASAILRDGVQFIEGRPSFSTNLRHAFDWAVNPAKQKWSKSGEQGSGRMIALSLHEHAYLGYGVFTTAIIHRTERMIDGAPLRYAAARKQLALYQTQDTEAARLVAERAFKAGTNEMRPTFRLPAPSGVGSFEPSKQLGEALESLDSQVREFYAIDLANYEGVLAGLFTPRSAATSVLVPVMMHELIIGTIEAIVMARVRMLRWQGLAAMGFRFNLEDPAATIATPKSTDEYLAKIDLLETRLASSQLFTPELQWLKLYALRQLELSKQEVQGLMLEDHD